MYRYNNIKIQKKDETAQRFYVNTVYPDIPYSDDDQYVYTTIGDRLDLMANDVYGDSSLWWILAVANALPGDSLTPPIGSQLRIPTRVASIIDSYQSLNNVR